MIHSLKITLVLAMTLSFFGTKGNAQGIPPEPDSLLREGRRLFALSVEDKDQIRPALRLFEKMVEEGRHFRARSLAYIGALQTIKAKHASFPFDKLRWAKRGSNTLDEALERAPDDIEVLFVHGTICQNLPGLFTRGDDAQRDFSKIVELLPENMHRYDEGFIADVLDYLNTEVTLSKEQQEVINEINSTLSLARGENN